MIIRKAVQGDALNLLNLRMQVEESNFMLYDPGERNTTEEKQRRLIESMEAEDNSAIFLAEENGELVGFLFAMGNNINRIRHSVHVAVGVGEAFRGNGVGTMLFQKLEAWAKSKQIRRLELTVIEHNIAGRSLYEKMGFLIEGTKNDSLFVDGKFVNEFYMAKLL
ncbi:GNAT family N-acetyltransferase [Neobacillus sp. PS3-34]|uniref:GNAT family N-acetyltransferase n=1 Tax=Neobacillus sp. PS3-34 TaxID=3070678 RepID=UPI0027DF6C2D|nr:GNAT family N-acetyltransferase [Neobacillus sp. PS3-34]WML48325.1 GNAT family N-acetyltransferase [Neobacillus sp. PS3-34]